MLYSTPKVDVIPYQKPLAAPATPYAAPEASFDLFFLTMSEDTLLS